MASLKDHLARHPCMELREEGDSFIFFCVLCQVTCNSPSTLSDHLKKDTHTQYFNWAKLSLLSPNPWPFNDGWLFLGDKNFEVKGSIGCGQIYASFVEKNGDPKEISTIWCEWLGEKDGAANIEDHDFAVITFNFQYDLGLPSRRLHSESKRMCNLCQREMLPGNSVATMTNSKTKRLCCKKGGQQGFHVCHVSCLILWILICECEILENESGIKCVSGSSIAKSVDEDKICSAFCPECEGNGVEEHDLKKLFSRAEKARVREKKNIASQKWMESPGKLENCPTGLYFPSETEGFVQVKPLKLLRFCAM